MPRSVARERFSFASLDQVLDLPDLVAIQRSSFQWFLDHGLAETFADSARVLVRKARTWHREALENLSRVLGQIENSFRDSGAKAREGPRK